MILRLCFGVGHARQLGQEALRCVDVHQIRVHPIAEHLDHLLRLALAQQPVVDVHADELLPDGLDQQRRDDRRIDPAGQRQQHPFIAHLRADFPHLLVDELRRQRLRGDARHRLRPFVVLHRSTPYPFLYAYCSVFLFASQKPMRASMYASNASIGMRSCAMRVAVAHGHAAVVLAVEIVGDAAAACRFRPSGGSACRWSRLSS